MVGNHDVGLGRSSAFSRRARPRYEKSFNVSDPNQVVYFGNHTLVLLDAPGLVEEDYRRVSADKVYSSQMIDTSSRKKTGKVKTIWKPTKGGSVEFVKRVAHGMSYFLNGFTNTVMIVMLSDNSMKTPPSPLILFSHIPLARPERANCGPLREGVGSNSRIQRGAGSGYQNLLGKSTSTWLLEELKPQAIFSADNHDYCEFIHSYLPSSDLSADIHLGEDSQGGSDAMRRIKEITVKAFSIAAHIRRPGIQLLSLWNPSNGQHDAADRNVPTYADKPCLLPDQTRIYTHGYLLLTLLTIAFLVWLDMKGLRPKSKTPTPLLSTSASFFDTPIDRRSYRLGTEDGDGTPRAAAALSPGSNLISRGSSRPGSINYPPSPSGLRTPVSAINSTSPSPLLNTLLLPPDVDDGDHSIIEEAHDEEKGLRTPSGSWTMVDSPLTERRITTSPVASVFSTKQWETGSWRRGSARNLFGIGGLGIVQSPMGETEREREKRLERRNSTMGWRDVTIGGGLREKGSRRLGGIVRFIKNLGKAIVKGIKEMTLGRPIAGSLWRRLLWDALLIAVPSWIMFALVTWYIMN